MTLVMRGFGVKPSVIGASEFYLPPADVRAAELLPEVRSAQDMVPRTSAAGATDVEYVPSSEGAEDLRPSPQDGKPLVPKPTFAGEE
jgi:hypothetical protein